MTGKTSPVLIRIYLVLCAIVVILCAKAWTITAMTSPPLHESDFSQDWVDETGEPFDLSEITKSATIYKTIPELEHDVTLFYRTQNIKSWAYIDGQLMSNFDTEYGIGDQLHYKAPGACYVWFQIPKEKSGTTLEIKILDPYREDDTSCNIKDMVIGDGIDLILSHIREKAGGYSICLLVVLLGILLLIFSVPLRKYGKDGNSLLYLGLFATVVGIWSMTETFWCQLIWGYSNFFHLITNLTLLLMVAPIYLFFRSRSGSVSNVSTYIVAITTVASFVICVFLHYFTHYDIHEVIFIAHAALVVGIIFTLYYATKHLIKVKFKDGAFFGLGLLAVLASLDLILYYRYAGRDNSTFTRLGVFIYIMILSFYVIRQYISVYNENLEIELLRKLAFIDVLTGFENRIAWSEKLKQIEAEPEKYQDSCIMVFDVNCLKYINDTYGHSMGDKSIHESSQFIKDHMGETGNFYRIGGDEFVWLVDKEMTDERIAELMRGFDRAIEVRNKIKYKDTPYPLYIASGKARIDFKDGKDASDAFNLADSEMYANKLELKRQMPEFDLRKEGETNDV